MSLGIGSEQHFLSNNQVYQQAGWVFSFLLPLFFTADTLGSLAPIFGHLHALLSSLLQLPMLTCSPEPA